MREFIEVNSQYHLAELKDVNLSLWRDNLQPTLKAKQEAPDIYLDFCTKKFQVAVDLKLSINRGLGHINFSDDSTALR